MNEAIFTTSLTQIGYLFLLMAVGFLLGKIKLFGKETIVALSKLETYVLIPAIGLGTFMKRFTVEKLSTSWKLLVASIILYAVFILLAFLLARLFSKDNFKQRIFRYAITFANFGYFGNAVMQGLYPDLFPDYLVFTLIPWAGIIVWGAPMLMGEENGPHTLKAHLKRLLNPMIFLMLLGMGIGLSGLQLPAFIYTAVDSVGECMSPVAMLLSGLIFARMSFGKAFRHPSVYIMTVLRLLVFPVAFLAVARLIHLPDEITLLGLIATAMPAGLNIIVIPAAYRDVPEEASGLALVSHLLTVISIPFVVWLFTVWK